MTALTNENGFLRYRYRGHVLKVPRAGYFIPYETFISGVYDSLDLTSDDVVVDAGANVGDFTLKAALSAKYVVAIEPNSNSLLTLRENTKDLKNVIVVPKALGEKKGTGTMIGDGVSSTVAETGVENVEITTLDEVANELNITPTILKMDIEGFEHKALPNQDSLKTVRKVVIETHSERDYDVCVSTLKGLGFSMHVLTPRDLVRRTIRNVAGSPLSFMRYETKTHFFATKSAVNFLFSHKTTLPSCDYPHLNVVEAFRSLRN